MRHVKLEKSMSSALKETESSLVSYYPLNEGVGDIEVRALGWGRAGEALR